MATITLRKARTIISRALANPVEEAPIVANEE
jgi:hypothetical protein